MFWENLEQWNRRGQIQIYDECMVYARWREGKGEYFEVKWRLRLGCIMFPWTFNAFLLEAKRKGGEGVKLNKYCNLMMD